MEGKIIGVALAAFGMYIIIYPKSRFLNIMRAIDTPTFKKRIVALVFIFLGVSLFIQS